MLAVLASSSFVQPLFGLWSDRRGAAWLLPGGIALAARRRPGSPRSHRRTCSSSCSSSSRGSGSRRTTPRARSSPRTRAGGSAPRGMSYFNIGGNTGYALGPIVVTPLVLWLGLTGGLRRDAAGRASSRCVLLRALPGAAPARAAAERRALAAGGVDDVRAMTLLVGGDRAAQRRVVRPPHVRAALGRRERGHRGRGEPRALADARSPAPSARSCSGRSPTAIGLRRTLVVTQAALPLLIVVYVAVGGVVGDARADARRAVRRRHLRRSRWC